MLQLISQLQNLNYLSYLLYYCNAVNTTTKIVFIISIFITIEVGQFSKFFPSVIYKCTVTTLRHGR